jgi:hypothetical protein
LEIEKTPMVENISKDPTGVHPGEDRQDKSHREFPNNDRNIKSAKPTKPALGQKS